MFKIIKNTLKVISGIIVAVLLFTELPICNIGTNYLIESSHFFRSINEENDNFKNIPLTEISMLGSHDALSNGINFFSKSNTNEDNITNNNFVRIIAKGLMTRLAKSQNENIYNQLMGGVRYIDTRITYLNGDYYNCHGLLSDKFETNILHILKFLDENPGEFVLMHIVHYYEGESNWDNLYEFIKSIKYNDKSLIDYVNYDNDIDSFDKLNYKNITNNGSNAGIVIFADEKTNTPFFDQLGLNIYSKWHNKVDFNLMKEGIYLASEEGERKGSSYLRINQAQQTPNGDEIFSYITSWSLLSLAKHHNYKVLELENIDEILNNLPIYMCDYATTNYKEFNTNIINKLRNRNLSL